MTLLRVLASGTALALGIRAGAQFTGNPAPTPAFPANEVGVVEVTCPGFNLILHPDSVWSDHLHPATLVWSTSAGSDTLEDVGFRLRGNTSRMAAKKSFKVDVNAFVPGRQWYGLEKLNLNGEHNDPSVVRARVVWDVFRAAGLPAPRTGHVELNVNGEYRGVYLHIEHVDEEWIRKRFADDGGNLWKCTYPADLSYQGPDGSDYQYFPPWSSTQRVYALQTNRSEDDYSAIARLASVLYLTPNANLPCALEEVFDVQLYLRTAAAEILAGHWDNYIGNRNNFYLYERPSDGRIAYLAYDVDNSLGIEWGGNWVNADPFAWTSENRPLYTRLMDIPQYREDLAWHIRDLLEGAFAAEEVGAAAAAHVALIAPAAETDVFRTYDYGFSYSDFLESVDEAWGNHVVWGIADFAAVRSFWADVQTEDAPDAPHSLLAWAEGPSLDGVVRLHAQVTGPATSVVAEIDGLEVGCTQEAPGMWACSVPASSPSSLVRAVAEFPDGVVRHSPCDPVRVWTAPAETPFVLLNEVMPLNNSYISDATGTYGDWVELYNPGPQPRFIGNGYLTDRLDLPRRWRLPNVTLNAGDHLLLWCDDRPEAGPLHAPFALDAAGEGLYLLLEELGALRIQDAFTWDAAFPNVSWGRSTDGAADWVAFSAGGLPPTPDGPNGTPAGIARPGSACTPVLPNPVAVGTPVALTGPAQVVAMTGAVVWRCDAPEGTWTPSAPGVYVVHRASCPAPVRVLALAAGGPG